MSKNVTGILVTGGVIGFVGSALALRLVPEDSFCAFVWFIVN